MPSPSKVAFPPELRTMGIVPRWSVIHTLNKEVVATHSYFVAVYSHLIADMIEWEGNMGELLIQALTHDLDEVFTGDIPGPVKDKILGEDYEGYIKGRSSSTFGWLVSREIDVPHSREIPLIIKAADRLDALLFQVVEKRCGNGHCAARIPEYLDKLYTAWLKLPRDQGQLNKLWQDRMVPSLDAHSKEGSIGS